METDYISSVKAPRDSASYHAKKRLVERFGINMTAEIEADLLNRIRSHKPKPIWQIKSQNRTVYRMLVKNRLVDVVYDWRGGVIVTCLPVSDWHHKEK